MGDLSPSKLILLLLVGLLLFGAKRLPEIGRSLGHGMREFKDSVSGVDRAPTGLMAEADEATAEPLLDAEYVEIKDRPA